MTLIKSIARIALTTALLLLIPLVAMQFTNEVTWSGSDFAVAGLLLFGTGLTYAVVAQKGAGATYRVAVSMAVAAGLLLIWINLAVGLIGSENNPANLLYAGVVGVAVIGAAVAGFRPRGMAYVMFAAALAQVLVPVVAAISWKPALDLGLVQVVVLNTVFAALWAASGWLFRRAATTSPNAGYKLALGSALLSSAEQKGSCSGHRPRAQNHL